MASDELLLDVADAVASSQQVDWDRARRAARVDQRRSLNSLHALSRMFAAVGVSQDARSPLPSGDPHGTSFLRFALGALVAVAAVQVAAAMVTITWYGASAWVLRFAEGRVLALVSLSSCALLLLVGGRRDHRARLLGVVFALGASSFSASFSWPLVSQAAAEGDHWILPEVFQPALMWAFAREFPRVHRRTGVDDLARRMVPISAWIGGGLWIANLPFFLPEGWLSFLYLGADGGAYWVVLGSLTLSAVSAMVWRVRDAMAREARRVALLVGGLVVGIAPMLLDITVELLWPAARRFGDEHRDVISAVVFTFLLSTPCSMTYAVLAEHALDVRTVVRSSYRRLLTRRLLGTLIAAPLGALGWLLASQPDRTIAEVMATSSGRLLVAAVVAGALTAACRKRLLELLDAWVYPATTEHRRLLFAAGSELVQAASVSHMGEVVTASVRRGCGAQGTLLVSGAEVSAHHFMAPTADLAPLARTSAIAHTVEATRAPIRVDPDDSASVFTLLPSPDGEWVLAAAATAIVPVFGPGSEVLGLVTIGRRFDDGRLSTVDLDFLQALATSAGLALSRVRLADSRPDSAPACECPSCGILTSAGSARPCGCGVDYAAAPVPGMLADKFLLERRLGTGGMGAVYLARDIGLQRYVAVKALPVGAGPGLVRLTQEARAMAAVAHPAVAQIHGLETWRDRPLLVVEYLPGGTLAARLGRGPLPGAEAVGVAVTLCEALTALHSAGYVHGDVKPSNIGFASDGTAKLLDFGLARLANAPDQSVGGTLPYVSPEVLSGGSAAEADDVWSLCVVLYEMVAGRRPFIGSGADEVAASIRRQRIPSAAGVVEEAERSGSPSSTKLIGFVVRSLTAGRSARPATARAIADALRGL